MNKHLPTRGDLRECEARLRASFDEAPVGMGQLDRDGCWLYMNRRLVDVLRLDAAAWQGRSFTELVHPDDAPALKDGLCVLLQDTHIRLETEARLRCGENAYAWCRVSIGTARTDDQPQLITCVVEPIDRRVEARLNQLTAIVESSDDAVISQDRGGNILSWNRGAERIYGYRHDEIIGRPIHLLMADERQDELAALLTRIEVGARVERHQSEGRRRDGSRFPVSMTLSPVHDRDGAVVGASIIGRDITGQVQAMEELRRTASLLDKVFSGVSVLIAYLDRDFNYIRVNRAYAAADGREPEYFPGKNLFALYPNAENEALFRLTVATGQPAHVAEHPFYGAHPERGESYWDWVVQPVSGADGVVEGLVLSLLNVTEKVKARQELEATAAYTRSLIEANLDPLVTIGRDGRITDVNGATEAVTGCSRAQLIGTDFSDYFTEPAKARSGYRQAFEHGQVRDYPLEIRHVDGNITPVLYNASVYRDAAGRVVGVFAAARDISKLRQVEEAIRVSEERLRQAQRIAHIGSWDLDLTTGTLFWSDEIYHIFEIERSQFGSSYEAFLDMIHPDDREAVNRAYNHSLQTREPYSIDHRLLLADGRIKYVHEQCETYYADDGTPLRSIGTVQDITDRKRTEAALREANAYNRRLIEASLDPLVTIGHNGTITDVNAATEKVTGRSRTELIGTDFSDYFTEPERARAGYRQAFEQGFVIDYPLELHRADGHVTPVLYNAAVYRDEHGAVVGVFAAARDITARKQAEEEALRLGRRNELLLQSAGEGIYGLDTSGRCTFVNPAAAAMLGYTPDELIGRDAHQVIHHSRADGSPYPLRDCPVQKAYAEGMVYRGTDEVYWRHDGSAFPIEYVSTPIREEGKVTGAVVTFLDITERKAVERTLRRLNQELDQRVKARTAELEAANKELESFSYSVSHDLRTPLRAIDGFSKILLTEYEAQLDEDGKRLLRVIRENTERMAQLISDILTFSRTGRAELKKLPVDMTALVREVWEEVRQVEPERTYDFRLEELPLAEGDRALLRQVLMNLLTNAAKFTRSREVTRIEVGCEVTDTELIYHVRDNGVGFDMRYVDRLFGVFQRLHSDAEFEGSGIGLAVVKRIVVRHGGRVWAESELDHGATFFVALPKAGATA